MASWSLISAYSPPHTSEDKSEDIPNSDEEEETLADKSSDELEEIMTDNENDESEELSEEEESSEAEDTDDEYRVPVKRRRRSEPSSNKSMLKRYRMESPEKEIPYREQQVTEKVSSSQIFWVQYYTLPETKFLGSRAYKRENLPWDNKTSSLCLSLQRWIVLPQGIV